MEHSTSSEEKILGGEDLDPTMQKIAEAIAALFKGWLHNPQSIRFRLLSEQFKKAYLSHAPWNNAINNPVTRTIWLPEEIKELSSAALESRIGHEIAHIALDEHPAYNPHYWAYYLNFLTTIVVGASIPLQFVVGAGLLLQPRDMVRLFAATPARIKRRIGLIGVLYATLQWTRVQLDNQLLDVQGRPYYPSFARLEEIVCDIIAMTTISRGGSAGLELYRHLLAHNGNTNGDGTHPSTQLRIRYHSLYAPFEKGH